MNSQEVMVEKPNITVVRGEIATLQLLLNKSVAGSTVIISVYRGDRKNASTLLLTSSEPTTQTNFAKAFFGGRLSPAKVTAISGTKIGNFELNITDAHYGDEGQFYLFVSFIDPSKIEILAKRNSTMTLNVKGNFLIYC